MRQRDGAVRYVHLLGASISVLLLLSFCMRD